MGALTGVFFCIDGSSIRAADPAPTIAVVTLSQAADASEPAVRVGRTGSIQFPMATLPRCDVLDSFGDARSGGRSHEGVDILSTLGQEIYAVADGTLVEQYAVGGTSSSLSGNAWKLRTRQGDIFFYAHMSSFASGLTIGSSVTRGQMIGYVGDTGNAGPNNFHLHFEYHPGGGAAANSLPLLQLPSGCRVF